MLGSHPPPASPDTRVIYETVSVSSTSNITTRPEPRWGKASHVTTSPVAPQTPAPMSKHPRSPRQASQNSTKARFQCQRRSNSHCHESGKWMPGYVPVPLVSLSATRAKARCGGACRRGTQIDARPTAAAMLPYPASAAPGAFGESPPRSFRSRCLIREHALTAALEN